MPEIDGYEATRKLKEKNKGLIIIAITARAMKSDHEKCLQAGCNAYLAKPIKKTELLEILMQEIKKRQK